MHGPTFMGNPLACSAANASIGLLLNTPWESRIQQIEDGLRCGLASCIELESVAEVRILGAIGVVEMKQPVDLAQIQPLLVDQGVWVRPFGRLIYLMPPYILDPEGVSRLTQGVIKVIRAISAG